MGHYIEITTKSNNKYDASEKFFSGKVSTNR
jgi:hypothetical protein